MARSTPNLVLRARIERGIRLVAPLLDLLLATADRTSRLLGSPDSDQLPAGIRRDGGHAARGLSLRDPDSRAN
jgi:hypothetical protein